MALTLGESAYIVLYFALRSREIPSLYMGSSTGIEEETIVTKITGGVNVRLVR